MDADSEDELALGETLKYYLSNSHHDLAPKEFALNPDSIETATKYITDVAENTRNTDFGPPERAIVVEWLTRDSRQAVPDRRAGARVRSWSAPRVVRIAKALRKVPPTLKGGDDDGGGGGDGNADVGQSPQGCFLGSLRSALGDFWGVVLEPFGSLLGASWEPLGGLLGLPGGLLEASWGPLGGLLGPLGGLLSRLGAYWGGELDFSVRVPSLGPLLGPSWGNCEASRAALGPS